MKINVVVTLQLHIRRPKLNLLSHLFVVIVQRFILLVVSIQ